MCLLLFAVAMTTEVEKYFGKCLRIDQSLSFELSSCWFVCLFVCLFVVVVVAAIVAVIAVIAVVAVVAVGC